MLRDTKRLTIRTRESWKLKVGLYKTFIRFAEPLLKSGVYTLSLTLYNVQSHTGYKPLFVFANPTSMKAKGVVLKIIAGIDMKIKWEGIY